MDRIIPHLEGLVHRRSRVIDRQTEGTTEVHARHIQGHRAAHLARHARAGDEERTGTIAQGHERRRAITQAQRDIRGRDADDGGRRRAGGRDLLEGEVATQRLAEHAQVHTQRFHAQIRPLRQAQVDRLGADREVLIHRQVGVIDRHFHRGGQ